MHTCMQLIDRCAIAELLANTYIAGGGVCGDAGHGQPAAAHRRLRPSSAAEQQQHRGGGGRAPKQRGVDSSDVVGECSGDAMVGGCAHGSRHHTTWRGWWDLRQLSHADDEYVT
jgi:hypothetical protein